MAKGTVNKVILMGRLGADPDVRYMPNGNQVTNINIATNSVYKDKLSNKTIENTEWHRIVLFNKLAEIASQFLKKGKLVYIEGRIRTNKWQTKTGEDRYTTEVIANNIQLISSNNSSEVNNKFTEKSSLIDNNKNESKSKEINFDPFNDEDDLPF